MTQTRKQKVRDNLRKRFQERIDATGGVDNMMAEMGGSPITWTEFRIWLDKQGMAVVHQDGHELMTLIDANGDGILQREELVSGITN